MLAAADKKEESRLAEVGREEAAWQQAADGGHRAAGGQHLQPAPVAHASILPLMVLSSWSRTSQRESGREETGYRFACMRGSPLS